MSAAIGTEPLLRIESLTKVYPRPESGGSFTVLENIDLEIRPNEIVALLGRSGSGKSTILRSIAGLSSPSSGNIYSSGHRVKGPNSDVAMVFQSFALLPWLTVQENVMVGLEAKHLDPKEAKTLTTEALRMVGLDGFERAYPKELSGGMQQRVGFARAFVVRPKILLLDEPFSALDVLTAENLRGEIADLWEAKHFPADSVLLVTHNIEEAIMLADRVVILSSNPGRIRGEMRINMPRPRVRTSADFRAMADHVYTIMTNPETKVRPFGALRTARLDSTPLPHARPGAISGLLELIEEYGGPQDVAVISERLRIEADDLLPILDAAVLLGFAKVDQGDATLTDVGKAFANAEVDQAHDVFRDAALQHAPMVKTMYEALVAAKKPLKSEFFLDILDESYSEEEAHHQFDTAVHWGRYAGLFEYDSDDEILRLAVEDEDGDEH